MGEPDQIGFAALERIDHHVPQPLGALQDLEIADQGIAAVGHILGPADDLANGLAARAVGGLHMLGIHQTENPGALVKRDRRNQRLPRPVYGTSHCLTVLADLHAPGVAEIIRAGIPDRSHQLAACRGKRYVGHFALDCFRLAEADLVTLHAVAALEQVFGAADLVHHGIRVGFHDVAVDLLPFPVTKCGGDLVADIPEAHPALGCGRHGGCLEAFPFKSFPHRSPPP